MREQVSLHLTASCELTFTEMLVLRVTTTTFLNQLFKAGLRCRMDRT
eukprot:SAG31_NODE_5191_length_2689_cov_3.062934_4_plen_47_part_00